jgi:anti-sigma factor RsiW
MTACTSHEPLLLERTCGTLDDAAAARLDAHLATCAACRAEAAALEEVLALVALPPPSAADRRALDGLSETLRPAPPPTAWRRSWSSFRGGAMALAAAAAALLVILGYPLLSSSPAPDRGALASAQPSTEAWREPDAADGWAEDGEDTSVSELGADEVAMAEALADDDGYDP